MKRYRIFYDGYDRPFCQMDSETGEIFDVDGMPTERLPDFVYEEWEQGGGRIEERDRMLGQKPTESAPTAQSASAYEDDDDYRGSTPPPWLDEFEYIDWLMTH